MKNSKVGSFLLSTVLLSSVAGATVVIVHDQAILPTGGQWSISAILAIKVNRD